MKFHSSVSAVLAILLWYTANGLQQHEQENHRQTVTSHLRILKNDKNQDNKNNKNEKNDENDKNDKNNKNDKNDKDQQTEEDKGGDNKEDEEEEQSNETDVDQQATNNKDNNNNKDNKNNKNDKEDKNNNNDKDQEDKDRENEDEKDQGQDKEETNVNDQQEQKQLDPCSICASGDECKSGQCVERNGQFICMQDDGLSTDFCWCDEGDDCASGSCSSANTCLVSNSNLCFTNNECGSAFCLVTDFSTDFAKGICAVPKSVGEECTSEVECATNYCVDTCEVEPQPDGELCASNADCISDRCDLQCMPKEGSCGYCNEDTDCISGSCQFQGGYTVCAETSDGKMELGCFCDSHDVCTSGTCITKDDTAKCSTTLKARGQKCEDDSECTSGRCLDFRFFDAQCL